MRVFWGAGAIGRKVLSFWKECGLSIDYFGDNNPQLIGEKINGVEVISLEKLSELPDDTNFFVTCRDTETIVNQLLSVGIKKTQIVRCNTNASILAQLFIQPDFGLPVGFPNYTFENRGSEVIFDLSNGLALGGIETWSFQMAEMLNEMGWKTTLLANNAQTSVLKKTDRVTLFEFSKNMKEWDKLRYLLSFLINGRYTNLICNFMGYFLGAACVAKHMLPQNINVIAVIHNDIESLYLECISMEQYIDRCLVISEKIKRRLLERGFPKEKILYLPWNISCSEVFDRTYSLKNQALRIGYAGRIVKEAKRIDYIICVAKKLQEQGIQFIIKLAGKGSFEEELKVEIKKNNLQKQIFLVGVLEHSKIKPFWSQQDVMISCSDYEGHSISQCEAMAAGAIPVITDVSGAKDDVEDGKNGYVVDVGDVEQIVDRICFLYEHRELLSDMGEKAYRTIKEKYSEEVLVELWKSILH